MLRPLQPADWDAVCALVNQNWKTVYRGYVNPALLDAAGCLARTEQLKADFAAARLREYVWAENGQPLALLSFGETADADSPGALEIWRVYAAPAAQGRGIGGQLLAFAEQQAAADHRREILIWAFAENTRALAFYQKHGYRVNKREYLADPYNAWAVRLKKTMVTERQGRILQYKNTKNFTPAQIQTLFLSVNWESGRHAETVVRGLAGSSQVLSAWDGDRLVGLIRALDDGATVGFIHYLLVDPAYQGQHIGGELLTRLLALYKDLLYIKIMPSDPAKIPFYEHYGFRQYENYAAMEIKRL